MEPVQPIYINLLVREQQMDRRVPTFAIVSLLLAVLAIGLWFLYGYQQKELQMLRLSNAELKAGLGQYKDERIKLQSFQKLHSQIQDKQNRVDQLRRTQISCVEIYEEIEHVLPAGLVLTGIEIDREKVLVNGYAADYQELAVFTSGLRKSRLLHNIVLITSKINEDSGGVSFKVEMGWEAGKK